MARTTSKPEIIATALDRLIMQVAPQWGERRMRSRLAVALAGSYYGGASARRSLATWWPQAGSANADTLRDLPDLRNRSRDLVRNAPIGGGAVATVVSNVVGTGLTLQSNIDATTLGMSAEAAAEWQRETELEWSLWATTTDCDVTRQQNFYGLQELAFRSVLESGDVAILTPSIVRPGRPYRLALQLIEADQMCNKDNAPDTSAMAGGVEMDAYGAPVAYWFMKEHPGEGYGSPRSRQWYRREAFGGRTQRRNVLHLFRRLRPGQTRGIPFLAPVIEPLKQLERYADAEIMAAVVSAMFTVFVKSDGEGLSPLDTATSGGTGSGAQAQGWDGKLGNGLVVDLAQGESIETANPGRPNANFDPFFLAVVKQIGVALELPFEVLMKHFNASYSASRAAMLDAWRFFRGRRDWLAEYLCRPVYELWLDEAVASGRIVAPGFFGDPRVRMAYLGSQWIGDSPGSIDPMKDADAAEKRIDIGISTISSESIAYDGVGWETKHRQRVKEQAARKAGDLLVPPKTATSVPTPEPADEQ